MTDKCFSFCIVLISTFFLVYGQDLTKAVDNKSQTKTLFLKTTWDGNQLSNKTDFVPVSFSAYPSPDSKHIIVGFNSSSLTIDQDKFLTPDVFGILFKGQNNTILQVEVVRGGSKLVAMFNGYDKPLETKLSLSMDYQEHHTQVPNQWNGTIGIPVEYFARGTNQLSAYANYSQAPDHTVKVLTLLSYNKEQKSVLPNLLRQDFFVDYVINADFTKWSSLWQSLINVSAGGTAVNQNETSQTDAIKQHEKKPSNNENSIIEQGLVTWILVSAVFCGMLHIFVLAL